MMNNPMQLFQMLRGAQDPMQMIFSMFGNNPQFNQVMQIVQGKSPQELEQYVRNAYQANGQDINQVLQQFGLK
jgi:hypothetical protein